MYSSRVHWLKKGATHYSALQGLPDKGCVIKELVVCCVLLNLIPRVFGQKRRDLTPLTYTWLLDLKLECHGKKPYPYDVIDEGFPLTLLHKSALVYFWYYCMNILYFYKVTNVLFRRNIAGYLANSIAALFLNQCFSIHEKCTSVWRN